MDLVRLGLLYSIKAVINKSRSSTRSHVAIADFYQGQKDNFLIGNGGVYCFLFLKIRRIV